MNRNHKKDLNREKVMKWVQWLFGAVVILVIAYFVLGEVLLPKENDAYTDNYRELKVEWYEVSEDGTRSSIEIPGECSVERGETAAIEAVLPNNIDEKEYICFRSSQQDVRIYIDGTLRTEYSTKATRLFGKNSASAYVFTKVTDEDEGKVIRVETVSNSEYSGVVNPIYIGERMSIWREFIGANGLEFVIAIFMVMLGIISIIVSMLLRMFYDKNIMLEYLGWGIVLAATWIISESKIRQLFFPNSTIIASMSFIVLMIMPLPFLIYMNHIQGKRYQPAYMTAIVITFVNLAVSVFLQMGNIRDFIEIMITSHIVIVACCAVIIITIVKDIINGYINEYKLVATGLLVFLITGLIELARSYFMRYLMSGIFMSIGLIVLLMMASIKMGNDIINQEREKQRMLLSHATQVGFLAHMSHEIRTPLNTVIGTNEMILREDTSELVHRYATDVKRASKTLEVLISDVLDFSKIQSGGFEIECEPYDLASFVNDAVRTLQVSAENKKLEVKYNIDESMPSVLNGDEVRIKRILNVLIENAVKHTKEGRITLSFTGDVSDAGYYILKMSVADTGKGIEKDKIDRLFHNFENLGRGKNAKEDGVGLGLDIVKRFTDLMNGEVKVDSLYGKGSLFIVQIPQEIISSEPIGDIFNGYKRECDAENMVWERMYAHLAGKDSYISEETDEKKYNKIPVEEVKSNINKEIGFKYSANSEEMYQYMLKLYYEQGEKNKELLAEAYEAKNWKDYAIKAHALKSTSLGIGAEEFSELAKRHEFAGKEENGELIEAEYQQFMRSYDEILEEVRGMCSFMDREES